MAAVVRPLMANPQQGAVSALWAATSPDARDGAKFKNGSYFTAEGELGGETAEADDDELVNNFWEQSEKVINQVTGQALGPWA